MWMSSPGAAAGSGRPAASARGRRDGRGRAGAGRRRRWSAARPSFRAIAGPVRRCRRSRSIAATGRGRRAMRSSGRAPSCGLEAPPRRPPDAAPATCRPCAATRRPPRRHRPPPAFARHPAHQKGSTMDRHARILVDVHPGLRLRVGWFRNPNLAAQSRMNNLHSGTCGRSSAGSDLPVAYDFTRSASFGLIAISSESSTIQTPCRS